MPVNNECARKDHNILWFWGASQDSNFNNIIPYEVKIGHVTPHKKTDTGHPQLCDIENDLPSPSNIREVSTETVGVVRYLMFFFYPYLSGRGSIMT